MKNKSMRKRITTIICFLFWMLPITSCATRPVEEYTQEHLVMSTLWVQNAAEYRALCYQAFNGATEKVKSIIGSKSDQKTRPSAVVFDIDETILNNAPYSATNILKEQNYDIKSWNKWVDQAVAQPIPGSVEFLKFVAQNGIEIFYISNRLQPSLESTYKNLIEVGFPVKKENILLKELNSSDSKAMRRKKVLEKYEIVMLVGDAMSDFNEIFELKSVDASFELTDKAKNDFGKKYIVIPNPIYGPWESAIYNQEHKKSKQEKFEDRLNHLYPMTE